MSERRWAKLDTKGFSFLMTDAEVLAEMGTEALVEELRRRGYQFTDAVNDYQLLAALRKRGVVSVEQVWVVKEDGDE